MTFELAAPPTNARFQVDHDGAGQPRLNWSSRITSAHWIRAAGVAGGGSRG